jgi:calcium/calmodulin-dependent protein kinase I
VIPKKKVKGNESSVWSEMEVLKGLNHPNIVRASAIHVDFEI